MNIVILMGRLVRDPKQYSNGVVKFTLAIDRTPDADGNKKTDFPGVTVFGKQADTCLRYLYKGRQVTVQGELHTDSYTGGDGKTVYTQEVVAKRVEFNDERKDPEAQPAHKEPDPRDYDYAALDDNVPF